MRLSGIDAANHPRTMPVNARTRRGLISALLHLGAEADTRAFVTLPAIPG